MAAPTITIDQSLCIASQHQQAGRLNLAEEICRKVLAQQPDHPDGLYLMGVLSGQAGRLQAAVESIQRAIAIRADAAEYHNVLGEYYRRLGRLNDAVAALSRAVGLKPDFTDAHNNLGNAYSDLDRLAEAAGEYREALRCKPDYAEAYSNLGGVLRRQGLFDAAIDAHRQAVRLKPEVAEIHNNYGVALRDKGLLDEAIAEFASAVGIKPDYAEAYNNLGTALRGIGKVDDAYDAMTKAARLMPHSVDILSNLGNVLKDRGLLDEAIDAHSRAIQTEIGYVKGYNNLAVALTSAGRLDEAIATFRRAVRLVPDRADLHSNLVYTLHFHPDYDAAKLLAEHRVWARRFADPLAERIRPHGNDRSPERKLRIGYLSPDFRNHPVGRFLAPLLEHHDPTQFEVVCYSRVRRADEMTERLRKSALEWHNILAMNDDEVVEQIRRDRIDVLVDLTLHMASNRLLIFAQKPAPVQVTWLGYVSTTGLETIDYRLSDPYLDPPGDGDRDYSESTVRLPHTYWCYEPPIETPPVNAPPVLEKGFITFGCFNNYCKVTLPTLKLWAELLIAVPRSRLVIHSNAGGHIDNVRRMFGRFGIEPDRIEFMGFKRTVDYFQQYQQVDIALDPFPYGGGTTTCDALSMGVPVVTLAGRTAAGRAGVSLLSNVGLPELIAATPEAYVAIACALAGDLTRLTGLRAGLRRRMEDSPLMNATQFATDMEAAYRGMWRSWCELIQRSPSGRG